MSNKRDVFIWGIETMRIVKMIEVKAKIHPETASRRI